MNDHEQRTAVRISNEILEQLAVNFKPDVMIAALLSAAATLAQQHTRHAHFQNCVQVSNIFFAASTKKEKPHGETIH